MALILDKNTITSLGIIRPWHVSQSIDAFTGIEAYDISLSGSFNSTGSFINIDENNLINIDSPNRTLYDSLGTSSVDWDNRQLIDSSENVVLDWSSSLTASNINITNDLEIGGAGYINGFPIITSAGTTGYVTSVNGVYPINGNVATTLTAVITGDSASLVVSSSGDPTGSIGEGTVWVISNDPDPNNNGDSYIFAAGPPGVWYPIAPLDQAAGDARYILKNGDDTHTGSLYISGSGITVGISGNLEVSDFNGLPNISSDSRILYDPASAVSINWGGRLLNDTSAVDSLDWDSRKLFDSSLVLSVNWANRSLIKSDLSTMLDWENGDFYGTSSYAITASYALTASTALSSSNFANTDLTFNGNRTHTLGSNYLFIADNPLSPGTYLSLDAASNQVEIGLNSAGILTLLPSYTYLSGPSDASLHLYSNEVIFNNSNFDVDFRIKGDNDNAVFFVDGGSDRVGIGKFTPNSKLDVSGSVTITGSLTTTGLTTSPNNVVGTLYSTAGSLLNPTQSVDADSYGMAAWVSSFAGGGSRNLHINNLSDGQSVTVYLRNTGTGARQIFIRASTTTSGHVPVSCSRGYNTSSIDNVTLPITNGTSTVWVANIGGNFVGSFS